jgi:hypothetical protein
LSNSIQKEEDFSEFDPTGKSEINPETVYSPDDFITKNKEIYKKKNIEESEKILDRQTADWICDNCSSQNFAKLLSGMLRVKCFKCQTARGSSCSLVLSVAEVRTSTYDVPFFLFSFLLILLLTLVYPFLFFFPVTSLYDTIKILKLIMRSITVSDNEK